jgi:glycosyltransferase involved in cell wall biosynthesis
VIEPATDTLRALGRISVLVPARNEQGNIGTVVEKSLRAFDRLGLDGEVLVVDDGSTDSTRAEALACAGRDGRVRVLSHRINMGLTAALRTGFRHADGDVVIFIPGDMESDPEEDLPRLLSTMAEGYDVVAGWRQGRNDNKVFASHIYNWVSGRLFHVTAHDMNWIKAFRREVVEALPPLRSDWHRFLLMIASSQGFSIGEVQTPYQPRQRGRSKYGFARIPISFLDVLVVKFLLTFSKKPMLFFGALGSGFAGIGVLIYGYLLVLWLTLGKQQRPLFWFAGVLGLAGLLLFLVGFVAELIVSQQEHIEELEYVVEQLGEAVGEAGRLPRSGGDIP